MDYIAKKVTKFCLQAELIDADQVEWCCYSLLTTLTNGCGFLLLMTIGLFISPWPQVLLLNLGVAFLRSKTGGLHMSTPISCFFVSLLFECGSLFILPLLSIPVAVTLLMISVIVLMFFAPCNNQAIHCSDAELATMKRDLKRRLLFCGTAVVFLFGLSPLWAYSLILSSVVVSLSVLLSKAGLGIR